METAVASSVVSVVFGVASYHLMNSVANPVAQLLGRAIGGLTALGAAVAFLWSVFLFSRRGRWLIEVTDASVSWQAPSGIGEASFEVPIRDIEKVVCLSSTSAELEDTYFLVTKPHGRIRLKPTHSGVDIGRFIQSLVDRGVDYETTNGPS